MFSCISRLNVFQIKYEIVQSYTHIISQSSRRFTSRTRSDRPVQRLGERFASLFISAAASVAVAAAYITFCFFQFNSNKKKTHISIQPTQTALCHSMRFVVCVLLVVWHRIASPKLKRNFYSVFDWDVTRLMNLRIVVALFSMLSTMITRTTTVSNCSNTEHSTQRKKIQNTYPFLLHYILLPHTWRWLAGLRLSWRPSGIYH